MKGCFEMNYKYQAVLTLLVSFSSQTTFAIDGRYLEGTMNAGFMSTGSGIFALSSGYPQIAGGLTALGSVVILIEQILQCANDDCGTLTRSPLRKQQVMAEKLEYKSFLLGEEVHQDCVDQIVFFQTELARSGVEVDLEMVAAALYTIADQ